jgi:uncharacterized Zn finger protein
MKKWIEVQCEKCGTEFSVPLRMVNDRHFIKCLSCGGLTPIFPLKKNQEEPPRLTYKPRKKNKKGGGYINGGYLKVCR